MTKSLNKILLLSIYKLYFILRSCLSLIVAILFVFNLLSLIISVSREKPCETCYKKHKKIEWDILHPLAPVERQLTTAKSTAYRNPVPNQEYVFNRICLEPFSKGYYQVFLPT